MKYKYIINPLSGRKISIFGLTGKRVLNKYIDLYKNKKNQIGTTLNTIKPLGGSKLYPLRKTSNISKQINYIKTIF